MGNKNLPGNLPAHLQGRGSQGGPMAGGYVTFVLGPEDIAAGLSTGGELIGFVAPFDMRIERVTWHGTAYGAGTGTTLLYSKAAGSFAVSGATTILASADLTADGDFSDSDFATSAARNVAKSAAVFIDPVTEASTGTIANLTVVITAFVKGHVNTLPTND